MKLGLITDIHEEVEFLRTALARFRHERVDQVVVIGDVFETGERIEETCHLLSEAKVVGALLEGRYAIFNSDTSELVPFNEEGRTSS